MNDTPAADDARRLVPLTRDVTSVVMISSRAVYVDGAGCHVNSHQVPVFDRPVTEAQPTVVPSDADPNSREGYGANKVAAEQVLLASGQPVRVLRPSRIHGAGAKRPLEWVFVKGVLDRRPAVLLADGGAGADHPTAAANLAALVEVVAAAPGRRILNCADPDVPTAARSPGPLPPISATPGARSSSTTRTRNRSDATPGTPGRRSSST